MSVNEKLEHIVAGIENLSGKVDNLDKKIDKAIYSQGFHAAEIKNIKDIISIRKSEHKSSIVSLIDHLGGIGEFISAVHPVTWLLTGTGVVAAIWRIIK